MKRSYRRGWRLLLLVVLAMAAASDAFASRVEAAYLPPVDLTRLEPASEYGGIDQFKDSQVAIRGTIFDGYIKFWSDDDVHWATWRVPSGYTTFQTYIGVNDESSRDKPVTFRVLINGDLAKSARVDSGSKAVQLSVQVRPGDSLRLEIEGWGGVFAEPRLLAGAAPPVSNPETTSITLPTAAAPFAVDPKDLTSLAQSLRSQVNEDAVAAARIARGEVAVATFGLIDIPAPSVAQNVAEDLTTAMIKAKFHLVERGQLDKVLKELKIQNMGLVDPKTALRIGQLSGCDVILLGSISDRGNFVVINARLMETATGKALVAEQVEMRKMPIPRAM